VIEEVEGEKEEEEEEAEKKKKEEEEKEEKEDGRWWWVGVCVYTRLTTRSTPHPIPHREEYSAHRRSTLSPHSQLL
jgi:hypothetical protein